MLAVRFAAQESKKRQRKREEILVSLDGPLRLRLAFRVSRNSTPRRRTTRARLLCEFLLHSAARFKQTRT